MNKHITHDEGLDAVDNDHQHSRQQPTGDQGPTLAALKARVDAIESQLLEATHEYNAALMREYPLQPGDIIESPNKGRAQVSSLRVQRGRVAARCRRFLKSGALGNVEHEIHSWDRWAKTP